MQLKSGRAAAATLLVALIAMSFGAVAGCGKKKTRPRAAERGQR